MSYPRPYSVALAIALMLKRSAKTRARITRNTFELLSHRDKIHATFLVDVVKELSYLGVVMFELFDGKISRGYGMISAAALAGAKPIKAADYLTDYLPHIRKGIIDDTKYAVELLDDDVNNGDSGE